MNFPPQKCEVSSVNTFSRGRMIYLSQLWLLSWWKRLIIASIGTTVPSLNLRAIIELPASILDCCSNRVWAGFKYKSMNQYLGANTCNTLSANGISEGRASVDRYYRVTQFFSYISCRRTECTHSFCLLLSVDRSSLILFNYHKTRVLIQSASEDKSTKRFGDERFSRSAELLSSVASN